MRLSEFDYELPSDLIAQEPLAERDASRMLVLDRARQTWTDRVFKDFTSYLRKNDVVVVNNSRVIPARLRGKRAETGGQVEIFLVREVEEKVWHALVRPGGRLKRKSRVVFGDGKLSAEMLDEPGSELRRVRFHCEGSFERLLGELGSTPLPPYIKQFSDNDRERYQTIYAKQRGAIAAPTAGLHFTPAVVAEIQARASLAEITLHVGYGTFEPVRVDDVDQHSVSAEQFEISETAAAKINEARIKGGRVIVVGTTTLRALESATAEAIESPAQVFESSHASVTQQGVVIATSGDAKLTIKPGYRFRVADALLTNFHLPQSSLLILVSAFAGREFILDAYRHAVTERYRFYSYGDCMLIL
ncbi:MAG: tRNA preQ1(34) S-adenosylmethionine ribosyltransferase-isomerase QueA [Pyrinomonadaceae bacterium]